MQNPNCFPTSEQAEQAFYRSFQEADIELMMSVWDQDEDIVCIHPGGPRLQGVPTVRKSWEQLFAYEQGLELSVNKINVFLEKEVAIHHVVEDIYVDGELQSEIFATNIYRKVNDSWHMVLHHASAELHPVMDLLDEEAEEAQTIH